MNQQQKDNIALWVKALRSGEYCQGIGALKRQPPGKKPCYCCLGVALDIPDAPWLSEYGVKETGVINTIDCQNRTEFYLKDKNGLEYPNINSYWPAEIFEAVFGLSGDYQRFLGKVNDSEHWDFEKIASHLEGKVEEDALLS